MIVMSMLCVCSARQAATEANGIMCIVARYLPAPSLAAYTYPYTSYNSTPSDIV